DLKDFIRYKEGYNSLNPGLHPSLHALIREMTELDRKKRIKDLYEVLHRIENYRDYDPELNTDLGHMAGMLNQASSKRHQVILRKLRNRLFDTSRRNRLLYYKQNMRFVNLTISSLPMVLKLQNVKIERLFTWNKKIEELVSEGKTIVLNNYLQFEDHRYLPSSLDRIRSEARKDVQEYGFSQLKLAVAFLNWHNFKESEHERIQSPLLLIPVELQKSKKVREDVYSLKITETIAEVNPVLANFLRDHFHIKLPDFIELHKAELSDFYEL